MKSFWVLLSIAFFFSNASAISLPEGYVVPKKTVSPTGRYGFMVPVFIILGGKKNIHDALVSMKSGKVIAQVEAFPGFNRPINYLEVTAPWWSQDESLVLWEVNGKWSPSALILIKFKNNTQVWQLNVLTAFQQKMLAYTEKAVSSEKYEAAKKVNAGCGSAYPEGFTIDVEPIKTGSKNSSLKQDIRSPLKLPLNVHVTLTSNPKQIPNVPNIHTEMDGIVKEGGIIEVRQFKLLP